MTANVALALIATCNYKSHIKRAITNPSRQGAGTENLRSSSHVTLMARNGESWP